MKILSLILVLLSAPVMALERCMSGSWYDSTDPGTGIDIQVLGSQTVGYYFTYGSQGKTWYVMLGEGRDLTIIGTTQKGDER